MVVKSMHYRLHTNNMCWWLPVVGRNGVGRLTQPDEPLSPLTMVHLDVPSGVALYMAFTCFREAQGIRGSRVFGRAALVSSEARRCGQNQIEKNI